ncbi:MAG TPA: type I-MYXAN CRISPR-associated endonuclease Cas1 [Leptospiraceae bacterium]|nr:type I-MYXAN CRISPR-associated endonuclease Cas1 [Leptospiraceae bacterium]HMW08299.1 type I-MYXAN CRISPR-associated endonuclease Cas1 [Leptospiraceae bacterium]HMY34194.1 type I-MYXAN CRISPR-associated endonuclease Cas1 [Leptospiraceae bacterium]HMZ67054.1 type I-MYXAN CRISPR-associated endonuclease Cas1 [Leptospiraceae bacterium]HNA09560.1 type I-MYXAN CRISPR-associated endonuclease Cas1 [Leptospiraceae bacterium]
MGLHSISYCERLFYLEEVEKILIADERVYEGRTLHEEIQIDNADINRVETFEYTSETIGLTGKVDRLQKRDGNWIPYEHKKGRSKSNGKNKDAWEPDIIQVTGYALLVEEATGRKIEEARIKYHKDNVLVKIPITEELKEKTREKIYRAKELMSSVERPPVAQNSNLCIRCSLAPVCLPEENRVIDESNYEAIRLFPPSREKETIHITGYKTSISKDGDTIVVEKKNDYDSIEKIKFAVNEIESINIHGSAQISSQLIHYLMYQKIPVHWYTAGGSYVGGLNFNPNNVQRKLRQYEALIDEKFKLYLAKKLTLAKSETQFKYLLRVSRTKKLNSYEEEGKKQQIRNLLSEMNRVDSIDSLRGYEGSIARIYHGSIPSFLIDSVPKEMIPIGRSKRPPKDRYNAVLSFLYSLLFRSVNQAIISVGIDPTIGFYHTPRSAAEPLVLDLMELFRVTLCDMVLIGSVNRLMWDIEKDFLVTKEKVWLSDLGRKKAIQLYEERLDDKWKHPVTNYSMSYYRMIELEVRLLEKEWTDKAGLFARARLR